MANSERGSVLIIHHRDLSSPFGTTAPYCLANEMSSSHTVHVVCRKLSRERADNEQNATLHAINTGELPLVSSVLFHVIALLVAPLVAVRHRTDVVYCFQLSIVQGWAASRLSGSRFVIGLDSVPVRQRRDFTTSRPRKEDVRDLVAKGLEFPYFKLVGLLLERSSEVLPLTEGIAEKTGQVYDVDLSDTQSLGMGVDVEKFSRRPSTTDGGSTTWTMTYIGTISEVRNLEQVLEAVAEVEHEVRLFIAGEGRARDKNRLVAEAKRLGIDERIEFLGMMSHDEIPELLSRTDFAISPLPDIESFQISFPAKLLEYLAAETIVVATDIAPHRKLIDDGRNGFLYDGSRTDLVETIERCIDAEPNHVAIKRRAGEVAEDYDWGLVVERYEGYLFDLPESAGPTGDSEAVPPVSQ